MMRSLILAVLLSSSITLFAQKKQINRIVSELNSGNFSEASEKIRQFEAKEGATPELRFVRYLYYKKSYKRPSDLDSAYLFSRLSFESLNAVEAKEREKLCKDFDFCESSRDSLYKELDNLIFQAYSGSRSRDLIVEYKKKYPGGAWDSKASEIIDSLDYVKIRNEKDLSLLENYINQHPGSAFNEAVQKLIYQSAFDMAAKSSDISALEKFLIKYPEAPQVGLAGKIIEESYWEKLLLSGSKEDFAAFIERYPSSSHAAEAKTKMWDMAWLEAERLNTAAAYREYYSSYPDASKAAEAQKRYEATRENVLPFLTREKKYRLFDIEARKFIGEESYDAVSILDQGRFIVSQFKKYGIVDNKGEILIPITYNCINNFGKFLKVQLGDKYALYDFNGTKVVDFLYEYMSLDKGYIIAKAKSISDAGPVQIDIIDQDGNIVFGGRFNDLTVVNDSIFIATVGKSRFLMNKDMKTLSARYEWITPSGKSLLVAQSAGKSGLIDLQGKVIVPLSFESLNCWDSVYFVGTNKLKQDALMNESGSFLINPQRKSIQSLGEGMFALQNLSDPNSSGPAQLYDARKGGFVNGALFNEVANFSGGFAIALQDGKCGIIDRNGRWKVPPLYAEGMRYRGEEGYGDYEEGDPMYYEKESDDILYCQSFNGKDLNNTAAYYPEYGAGLFNDDLAVVQIESSYGYVNTKGDVKIPIIYSYAQEFSHGIAQVTMQEGEKYVSRVIDRTGKAIAEDATIMCFFENNQKAILKQGEQYHILDLNDYSLSPFKVIEGLSYLTPVGDYFVSSYKEKDIVILSTGEDLMALNVDFSEYDFKQKVLEANAKFYSGEYDEAIREYRKLLAQRPNNFTVNFMLAKCYSEKKDNYNMETYLDKAIGLKFDNEEARVMRLDHNYERKEWREVINDANILLSASTYFNANLYFKRAYANAELGNEEEAFSDYAAVIQNNSNFPNAFNNRGIIYLKRKQYAMAISDFNNAIKYASSSDDESNGLYYANKGNALYNLNKKAEACAAWRKGEAYGNSNARNNVRVYCR